MPAKNVSSCHKITLEALRLVLSTIIDSLCLTSTPGGETCYCGDPVKRATLGMAVFEHEYHALTNVLARLTGGKA